MKKKSVLSVLALSCVLCLCSCNTQTKTQTSFTESTSTPSSTVESSSTPFSTVESSYTQSSTAESSSYSSVESSEEENNWTLHYYVDEFNEPTDHAYIGSIGEGTFSNSATTKSELLFLVSYDKSASEDSRFQIKLYEYGRSLVNNTYSSTRYYTIRIKVGSSTATKKGTMNSDNGDRIFVNSSEDIVDCLKNGSDVTFSITQDNRPSTQYLFKVKAEGFSEAYNKL